MEQNGSYITAVPPPPFAPVDGNGATFQYKPAFLQDAPVDPLGDTPAFYPPFLDLGEPISAGWTESATFYHSEASREMVDPKALEKIARAHAYVVEELFHHEREDLARGGSPRPPTHFYYSDLLKMVYGNF